MSRGTSRPIVRGAGGPPKGSLDLAWLASVEISSEQTAFPIDNVFDSKRGPGGSCWVAASAGEQLVVIRFRAPQDVGRVEIECEERADTRTQQIALELECNEGVTRFGPAPQTLAFAPYGPSFHRASWKLVARAVEAIRIRITPVPATRRATLTSVTVC